MNKMVLNHTYDAPLEKVWKALTSEDILKQWWAPEGLENTHVSIDKLEPGGVFRFCMSTPDGADYWGRGLYTEIVEPSKLVYMDAFTDQEGNPVPPSYYGHPGDDIVESAVEFKLTEEDGTTTLKTTLENFEDESLNEESIKGWNSMFKRLENILE